MALPYEITCLNNKNQIEIDKICSILTMFDAVKINMVNNVVRDCLGWTYYNDKHGDMFGFYHIFLHLNTS